MTTRLTPETDPTRVGEYSDANAELRAHNERLKARATSAESELMSMRLEKIGLNPAKGLGKAIAKEYQGEYTIEAISAYAREEYGHESEVEESPMTVEIETAQAQADQLARVSQPIQPITAPDVVRDLENKVASPDGTSQDAKNSIATKMSIFANQQRQVQ